MHLEHETGDTIPTAGNLRGAADFVISGGFTLS